MASFKKLSKSDVTFVPYHANKQWNLTYFCLPISSSYLTIYKGTNLTSSFNSGSDPKSENQYERLIYSQINQLFYQEYTSLLNTSSLANSIYYESASVQRPTSSYFIYNDNDNLINYFPTGVNESIRVIAINQSVFGNKILPYTFILSSSAYRVIDDGYGNLYDGNTHIGNIFYAQGLGIITNQDYQLMFPTSSEVCNTTTTTSTTTTTTTAEPTTTTTSTTTTTTTAEPTTTTSTTTTTTTEPPTTSTTTTTTTDFSTTTTTTTSTTTTTTTAEPTTTTTSTTTTTTTPEPTTTTSTTTTTTTAEPTTTTTTTTSTTTTTTTVADVNITLYAKHDPGASTFPSVQFAYSTDGGSNWTAVGSSFTDTTCSQRAVVTVPQGSSLNIKITEAGNTSNTWQSARDLSTCPSFTSPQCTWAALTNIDRTYYFTLNGDDQGVC